MSHNFQNGISGKPDRFEIVVVLWIPNENPNTARIYATMVPIYPTFVIYQLNRCEKAIESQTQQSI